MLACLAFCAGCRASERAETSPPKHLSATAQMNGRDHAVALTGLNPATLERLAKLEPTDSLWSRLLAVYVDAVPANGSPEAPARHGRTVPAVIGTYRLTGDSLRFQPRFPFAAGVAYRIDVDTAALGRTSAGGAGVMNAGTDNALIYRFDIPAAEVRRTTTVLAVHPSATRLPSNLLRWYVEFSAPMEPGSALEHVHLLDESGREVRRAFLALDQELWDPERRRVTLLFDPGRVKRGVRTNLEAGAPLVAGRRYRLVIDPEWPDGAGAPLASGFEHAFTAGDADRRSPDPARWRLTIPRAGTRDAFRVAFREPLDHALAARMVSLTFGDGRGLGGSARVAQGDSVWTFVPTGQWVAGDYVLRVNAALEDVAGNSVAHVFDVDRRQDTVIPVGGTGSDRAVRFRIAR